MPTIHDATRMAKRILLSNLLTNDHSIALTPLISGRHGIGKSQIAKQIAQDLNGICMTIEGGTLKEGEITGIPYQYRTDDGKTEFRFLPYYAIQRIQEAEKIVSSRCETRSDAISVLKGDMNRYGEDNLSFSDKLERLNQHEVTPVILFFDEINRTQNAVFRELMNIILTRTVNGYRLPWWVFIIAAMNPSTQNSIYATNDMDPAQTDRFIKLAVHEDTSNWLEYAVDHGFEQTLVTFIDGHPKALCEHDTTLEDDDLPTPSPRGWGMVDLILKGKNALDSFFTNKQLKNKEQDIRTIMAAKVGSDATAMYYTSLKDHSRLILADHIFDSRTELLPNEICDTIRKQSAARNTLTSRSILKYLTDRIDTTLRDGKDLEMTCSRLKEYINLLDPSSKLLFAVSLTEAQSEHGTMIFDHVYEVFDETLLELLQSNNLNDRRIMGEK